LRQTETAPSRGVSPRRWRHTAARPSMPLRNSTGSVATKLRLCGVSWSIAPPPKRPAPRGQAARSPRHRGCPAGCHRRGTARSGACPWTEARRGQRALPQHPGTWGAPARAPRVGLPAVFSGLSGATVTVWPRAGAARPRPARRPDPRALGESARWRASGSGASARTAPLRSPIGVPRVKGSRSACLPPGHRVLFVRMTVGQRKSRFTHAGRKQTDTVNLQNLPGDNGGQDQDQTARPAHLLLEIAPIGLASFAIVDMACQRMQLLTLE
jgi:hypothetical protein